MISISSNLNLMIKAAEKASKSIIRDFGEIEKLQVSKKGPHDFVTKTDKYVEIIIGTILGSNVFNGVAIGAAIGILGPGEMVETNIIGWLSAVSILLAAVTWGFKSLSSKPVGKFSGFTLLSIYVFWLVSVGI